MNKQVRKELSSLVTRLQTCKTEVDDLKDQVSTIQIDQEEILSNIPENLQTSDRYDRQEEATENLADALEELEDAVDNLERAVTHIESAIQA